MADGHRQAVLFVEAQHFLEAFQLQAGMRKVDRIGIGKVGENPFHHHMLAVQGGFLQRLGAIIMDADAFHARIDFQMDFRLHAHPGGHAINLLQAFYRGGRQGQVMLQVLRHLVTPDPAQHQDRCFHAQFAQEDALLQHCHADIVRQRGKVLRHLRQTMSIGIGFDNDHHPGRCNMGADGLQVAAQPAQVYFGPGGTYRLSRGDDGLVDLHGDDCTASCKNLEIFIDISEHGFCN